MTSLRRPRLALALLALAGLLAALFGGGRCRPRPRRPAVPVTVTATVNGHTYNLRREHHGPQRR